jgi:beta-glucanase (GH16 family)
MHKIITFLLLTFSITLFSQEKVEDNFEGNGTIAAWTADATIINTAFSNPFKSGINTSNTVLRYQDNGGQYANVRFDVPKNFNLSEKHTFSLKIYVPSNSITGNQTNKISLKLQNNTINAPWSSQSEVIKTISLDTWQTVTFDFKNDPFVNLDANSPIPTNRTDFNRILLQVNGENNTDQVIAFIDDFAYDGTLPENNVNPDENVNFDTLVWSDEFNGNGAIDNAKWHHQVIPIIGGQSWANGEVQHYTNRSDNSYMSNGSLKIVAKKENYTFNGVTKNYTSARLNSKYAFTYGKVEIKAKMPFGVGTFPALWMLGQNITETGGYWTATHGTTPWPDCGEIDIIEHWGDNQNFVQSAMHNRASFGGTVNKGGRMITNASTEYHIYTIVWSSNKMIFSVDDIVHYTYEPSPKNIQNWPYDSPQYLLFNVAMLPNVTGSFTESAMEIDYVRVYQASSLSTDNNNIEEKKIRVFPNPVNDFLEIQFTNFSETYKGTIYDLTGKKVHAFNQNSLKNSIDVSFLKSGFYILNIQSETFSKNFKILKN